MTTSAIIIAATIIVYSMMVNPRFRRISVRSSFPSATASVDLPNNIIPGFVCENVDKYANLEARTVTVDIKKIAKPRRRWCEHRPARPANDPRQKPGLFAYAVLRRVSSSSAGRYFRTSTWSSAVALCTPARAVQEPIDRPTTIRVREAR